MRQLKKYLQVNDLIVEYANTASSSTMGPAPDTVVLVATSAQVIDLMLTIFFDSCPWITNYWHFFIFIFVIIIHRFDRFGPGR